MKITSRLKEKSIKAVRTTMRIEGYSETASPTTQAKVRALMGQRRVEVSVPRK